MPNVVGVITARGGSKGVPRKNLRLLGGRPLIAWTIDAARQSRMLNRFIVSTDDEEIAETARQLGAEVPFRRPPELAQDASAHAAVLLHAAAWLDAEDRGPVDYLVTLQPTSPLRTAEDIDAAVKLALQKNAEAVVSVSPAHDHPYLARRIGAEGLLEPFVPCDLAYPRRQDLPAAYALNGAVYVNRRDSLLERRTLLPPASHAYVMPIERSLEIDSPWDLHVAELILQHRQRAAL